MNTGIMSRSLMRSSPAAGLTPKIEPQDPRPVATLLQFPTCTPEEVVQTGLKELDVIKLFSNINRTSPQLQHLEAFGISLTRNVSLEAILPNDSLPPISWLQDPALTRDSEFPSTSPHSKLMSNGRPTPDHTSFWNVVKELQFDNADAFRAARRQGQPQGRPIVRVAYARNFWNGAANMVDFWNTLNQHLDDAAKEKDKDAMDIDELRTVAQKADDKKEDEKKGARRLVNQSRDETVSCFVDMVVRCFNCTIDSATIQPKVEIQGVNFPMPWVRYVYRTPKDSRRARMGVKEGPLMGVSCRGETMFRDPGQAEGTGTMEVVDLLREAGTMIMLAQRRAREGKEAPVPGAGKWWAHTPRWGGGPGGKIGSVKAELAETAAVSDGLETKKRPTRKLTQVDVWAAMHPPMSTWEKGVTYQQVGREKGSVYDNIYLISSVNHHISILHCRIHNNYIDYISSNAAKAKSNYPQAPQQAWYALKIQRSKWYDLFEVEDRIEAVRGVWGVMNVLMKGE